MQLTICALPYASGQPMVGMGLGPVRYLEARPETLLADHGHETETAVVQPRLEAGLSEPDAVGVIDAALALAVATAGRADRFPLVLAGNCNSCLGTIAGARSGMNGADGIGVVWFDAHGDLNTPETTPGGFFDGMGLAIATGRAYDDVRQAAGLSEPVPEACVAHIGARDLDPPESDYLATAGMLSLSAAELQSGGSAAALEPVLRELRTRTADVYLHIDIDVLSNDVAPGVDFPAPGGLSLAELERAVSAVAETFTVRAAALTAYDPARDRGHATLRSGLRLMEAIADAVGGQAGLST